MSIESPSSENSLSLEAMERIAEELIRFSRALKNGENPSIEAYLEGFEGDERAEFLQEMILCEFPHLGQTDELITFDTYRERFPEDVDVVDRAEKLFREGQTIIDGNSPPPSPPKRLKYLGEYEILEEIAQGGMGVVYKARQKSLKINVALKTILAGHLATEEDVKRFRQEARMAARLKHPNIVPVHEVGEDEGHHYLTMDLINGESLADLLREETLPAKEAAKIVKTLAEAVEYAHTMNILHRDLKPANVILDERGQPHLTDFGLAKITQRDEEDSTGDLTRTRQILGTAAYMSPEQATGHNNLVGPASDIYSLGAVLYACVTGRPPHLGESTYDTLRQVVNEDTVSPRRLNPSVPKDLETICLKCLSKEPDNRYGKAKKLADDLGRFLKREPVEARPVGRLSKAWRWFKRNPAMGSVSAGLAMVLLVLAIGGPWVAVVQMELRDSAEKSQLKAKEETAKALAAAEAARLAKRDAVKARDDEAAQRKIAEQRLYYSWINRAARDIETGHHGDAVELLSKIPFDQRGWEARYLLRMAQGTPLTIYGHQGHVGSVAFSPDGRFIVSSGGGRENTVKVWDAQTGETLLTLHGEGIGNKVMFSPDNRLIAAANGNSITVWDSQSGKRIQQYAERSSGISQFTFSPDSRLIAYGYYDEVKIIDASTGVENKAVTGSRKRVHFPGHSPRIVSLDFSADGRRIVAGFLITHTDSQSPKIFHDFEDFHTVVMVWNARTSEELYTIPIQPGSASLKFSPDDCRICAVISLRNIYETGMVKMWDAQTGTEVYTRMLNSGVQRWAFSPDGRRIALVSYRKSSQVRLIDILSG